MKLKKTLSLFLVFVLMLSMGISVFADGNITAELKIDKIGHIFTDKAVNIKGVITNSGVGQSVEHKFIVKYEDGSQVYSSGETINIDAGSSKTVTASFYAPKYGFYNVSFSVNGKTVATTRFSVVHAGKTLNKKIGLNTHYTVGRGLNEIDKVQKLFADTGFGQMREPIFWVQYEPTVGELNLSSSHTKMLEAFEKNEQNHLLILGHNNTAHGIDFPRTEEELKAWTTYVEELAKDVAPYGVKDFELWNEVNMKSDVTAEDYVNLMKVTKPILDKYIEDNRLFVFSLAGESYTTAWSDYMDECLAIEGCIENFDGISFHPYYGQYDPEEKFSESLSEIEETVEKWGLEDKALVISEAGWTYYNWSQAKEDTQAKRAVRLAAMAYDKVEYIDWYVNIEKIDAGENLDQVHFGWLKGWKDQEINYEAKPVFLAMANFNALLAGAESNGSEINDNKYIYKFKKDGKNLYMIWKTGNSWLSSNISLNVGTDKVLVYDFYGNSQIVTANDGVVKLKVTDEPIYVSDDIGEGIELNANTVTIRGMAEEANQKVTILVSRPDGVTVENTGGFVYFGETTTDENGLYKFSFRDEDYDKGEYSVTLRVGDLLDSLVYTYSIAVPNITLLNENNEEISVIDDITGNKIIAKLEIVNIKNYTVDGMMVFGLYKDNILVEAQTFSVNADKTESVKDYPITYSSDKEIDTIKVFLWDNNYSPLIESITVE